MITFKDCLKLVAKLKVDECRELGQLMTQIAELGPRDGAREAILQDYINSLPDPIEPGMAELLNQGRMSARELYIVDGICTACGGVPATPSEEQEA